MPNSSNKLFVYNKYVGEKSPDEYITKYNIVSENEAKTIIDCWDAFQAKNEEQFEIDYMNSTQRNKGFKEETEEEEE